MDSFGEKELDLFRNRPVRQKPTVILDGAEIAHLPSMTLRDKRIRASRNLSKHWNTPLRKFWRSVYIHYLDMEEKGGTREATRFPPSDNHDGTPAA